jgi:hypothetical protein
MSHSVVAMRPDAPELRLIEMLAYRRPAWGRSERLFIERYIKPTGALSDAFGNYWLEVGEGSHVIWSCHTDTVHYVDGMQSLRLSNGKLTAPQSSCLGADCGVGVWLMLEMIASGVPGLYIFHRDEEAGGRGSSHIAKRHSRELSQYDFAIAFDRRGNRSVITHQGGAYGASQAFVDSITPMLPRGYAADAEGIFTDTAQYTDFVGECTNLSVGYTDEHRPAETLDVDHAMALRACMVIFDERKLVCKRVPGEEEWPTYVKDFDWRAYDNFGSQQSPKGERYGSDYYDLTDLCRREPDLIADYLEQMGLSVRDILGQRFDA